MKPSIQRKYGWGETSDRVIRSGSEAGHSTPSNGEVKNDWSCNSTSSYTFRAFIRASFIDINKNKQPVFYIIRRSPWQRGVRRMSATARLLGLRFLIPPAARISVPLRVFCMLWDRCLCVGLFARPEESYRVCVCVCVRVCVCGVCGVVCVCVCHSV